MNSLTIVQNNNCSSFLIPEGSVKVRKAMQLCAEKSQGSCLVDHFAATAYAISAVAISFFNVFVYAARGLGRFILCIITCKCKDLSLAGQDFKSAGKSFLFTAVGAALVVVGLFFPKTAFDCFAEKKAESLSKGITAEKSKTALPPQETSKKKIADKESSSKKTNIALPLQETSTKKATDVTISAGKQDDSSASKRPNLLEIIPESVFQFGVAPFLDRKSWASLAATSSSMKKLSYNLAQEFHFPEDLASLEKDGLFKNASTFRIKSENLDDPRLEQLAQAIENGKLRNIKHLIINETYSQYLRKFELHSYNVSNLSFVKFVKKLSNLQNLTFHCFGYSFNYNKILREIIKNIRNLRQITLPHVQLDTEFYKELQKHGEHLEVLDLNNVYEIKKEAFEAIAKGCPNLRELHYHYHYPTSYGKSLNSTSHLLPLKGRCKKIEILDLTDTEITPEGLELINSWKLRSLELWNCKNLTSSHLSQILSSQPSLRHLNVGWSHTLTGPITLEKPHALRSLRLTYCYKITDDEFSSLISRLPDLEELDIYDCGSLTNRAIDALKTHCPKLRSLIMSEIRLPQQNRFCPGMQEAVDSLRSQNPKLKIIFR